MASSRGLIFKSALVVAVLAAGAYFGVYFVRPEARVAKVFSGVALNAVPGSVVVRAEYAMELKNEIGGRVIESKLDEGKLVKAGDFLLQLDPADLELEIERIENDLKAAKSRLEIGSLAAIDLEGARADLQNAERQFKLGSISDVERQKYQRGVTLLEKRVQLENAANQQAVETLENALKVKKRQLEKTRMVAPVDGKISALFVHKSDLIGGSSQIATVITTSRTVEARISEENFAGLRLNQKALVSFLGYGSKQYEATVAKILPTADPETQRYIIHLDVKIDPELLVPGITGDVSITIAERESKTLIPRRAVFGNYVYVVREGKVEPRKIELGYIGLNTAEVVKGLNEGELVIVEELDRFRSGQQVRIQLITK